MCYRDRRIRGFTLVEILVVVAIIGLLIAILLPALTIVRRQAAIQNDKSNLRGIYQGIMGYASENSDRYPAYSRTLDNGNTVPTATGFNQNLRDADIPDNDDIAGNLSAALWLMVKNDHLPVKIFVNPASLDSQDDIINNADEKVTVEQLYDFGNADNVSYSFLNFYHHNVHAKWSNSVGPTYVLAGNDNNGFANLPGGTSTNYRELTANRAMNSLDHDEKGQNFVFGDGHAEFLGSPVSAFNLTDNAYTYWDSAGDNDDDVSADTIRTFNLDTTANPGEALVGNGAADNVNPANLKTDVFLMPVESLQSP